MAIPNIEQRFLDAAGRIDVVWHRFLRELGPITDIAELQAAVAALQDALAAIGTPRDVIGQYSVQAIPGAGAYYLHLLGDTEEPGFTYYYGTGPDGLKGWYPVADTVEAAADELTKAVDAEGVVTFGLADTAVTPGTYTNATVTVDEKGRITAASSGGGGDSGIFASPNESWDFVKQGVSTSAATGTSFITNGAVPVAYTFGSGSGASLTSAAGSPGIVTLTTGSTTTGRSRMFLCPPCILLGGGVVIYRARIRIPTLSDATNRFSVIVLASSAISGAAEYIGAVYTDNVNSGQWVASAVNSGGTTDTNTITAPAANTWTVLELRANAAGTEWTLYIGPDTSSLVSVGTVAANIPAVALGLAVWITKSAGTTARTVDVDVASYSHALTATR